MCFIVEVFIMLKKNLEERSQDLNANDKRAHGLVVDCLLGMQDVEGSIPSGSIYLLLFLGDSIQDKSYFFVLPLAVDY